MTLKLLVNPLIYALRMQHIRDSVVDLFYTIFPWRQRPVHHTAILPHNQTLDTELVSRRHSATQNNANSHSDELNNNSRRLSIMEQRPLPSSTYPHHHHSTSQTSSNPTNGNSSTRSRIRNKCSMRFSMPLDFIRHLMERDDQKGTAGSVDLKSGRNSAGNHLKLIEEQHPTMSSCSSSAEDESSEYEQ